MSLKDRFTNAWNAFSDKSQKQQERYMKEDANIVASDIYTNLSRGDRYRMRFGNERSIINSIYNRIANDVASVTIQHVRVDENDRYLETMNSGLNECLTLSANLDQTSRDFWIDLVLSMLDEGVVAAVPVDTNVDLFNNNAFDILTLRTGRVAQWNPASVRVEVYNERAGKKEEILLPKERVAIIENPFYSIMNEPNSTLKRLIYKLNLLDQIDSQKASSKLNLLIQLPYSLKSPARLKQAEERRNVLEDQLENSKYGVAYIDSTEHVTQLGRPIENDLAVQINDLTNQLYAQLGVGEEVFKGTANQEQMLLYNNKVLEPILSVIQLEFTRKFLTPTARTQGQKVAYHQDPFRLVPVAQLADIADKFTRNEILSSNEFRATIGFKASDDPRSDQLINKNIPTEQINPSLLEQNQNGSEQPEQFGQQPSLNADESPDELATNPDLEELEQLLNNTDLEDELSDTEKLLEQLEKELEE